MMEHFWCVAIGVFIVGADIYMRMRVAKNQYLLALQHVDEETIWAKNKTGTDPSPRAITQKLRKEAAR